jgi:hypothetical protein
MRQCKKCLQTKPILDFTPSKNCKEGRSYVCKICRQEQRNKYKEAHPTTYYGKIDLNKARQRQKKFYLLNPKYALRYKLKPTKRQPSWADKEKLQEFYANCPEGYHVDHIIPLRGKLVSGLHVPENLQYLPALENIKKGNKYAVF